MNAQKKRTVTALLIFSVGCLFLLAGIRRGEQQTVEKKSGIICLECIGVG